MKIIFVRHGETNENAKHCYLGHSNPPLNDHGREQIRQFTKQLFQDLFYKKTPSLYSSDLERAQESARIIGSRLKLSPTPIFSLRELNFGDWECLTYQHIFDQNPELLTAWIDDPFSEAPPNGETLTQLGLRFDGWFEQLLHQTAQDETIIIVCHGGPIRWFLSKWHLGDRLQFWKVEGLKHGTGISVDYDQQTQAFTNLKPIRGN